MIEPFGAGGIYAVAGSVYFVRGRGYSESREETNISKVAVDSSYGRGRNSVYGQSHGRNEVSGKRGA